MENQETAKVGRPSVYKPEYCQMLIDHMASGLSFESFAGLIGVCRATVYNFEKHPEFLDAKKIAFERNRLFWEKVGVEGMFMGGKDNPFNATVWVFNMKNRFNWSDKKETSHNLTEDTKKLIIDMGD